MLKKGDLVILESTVSPETTDKLLRPILEKSGLKVDKNELFISHCPERVLPGRILFELLENDRVIGGLNEESISVVYEKPGSLKIGHYLPGTRIPICSDEDLFELPDQTQPILNLAWHIPNEIREYLAEHGYTGPIIDILGVEDFK